MDWQEDLISLYVSIFEFYFEEYHLCPQRFSNNNNPDFSDVEVATIYLWGLLSGYQEHRQTHTYVNRHLLEWFPGLPKYSAYVDRVNRLDDFLCALTHRFMGKLLIKR